MSSGSVAIASGSVQRHSPWLAVAGVCGVYVSFGLAIGVMAPLVDEISSDLSLSRSAMGSILGAWALIYVFTAVPGGAVVDRLGLRWSLLVGSLTITASLLLRSMANGPVSLFAAVAVFGIGGPLVSIATPKLVASLFDADERRLPTGLGVSSPALGTAIALAVTNPILLPAFDGNWRPVLVVMAAVSFLTTLGWLYASRAITHVEQGATRTDRSTIARLLKLRSMRTILAITLFSFFFSHALSNWLPEILADTGQSDNAAGYLSAISVTVGIVGSLSIARLVPSPRRPLALVAIFAVAGADGRWHRLASVCASSRSTRSARVRPRRNHSAAISRNYGRQKHCRKRYRRRYWTVFCGRRNRRIQWSLRDWMGRRQNGGFCGCDARAHWYSRSRCCGRTRTKVRPWNYGRLLNPNKAQATTISWPSL